MNYYKKLLNKLSIIVYLFLLSTLLIPSLNVLANSHLSCNHKDFHLLIINSYDSTNKWEKFILDKVKDTLNSHEHIKMNIEYLDIKKRSDDEYKTRFLELLNLKYKDETIDAVLTIDDEAFDLSRQNLFNTNSIFFKIPILFVGVNETINILPKELNYITGIISIEDNIKLIDMILNIHKDVEEINVILDNAKYSNFIKENITNIIPFTSRPVKINFIQSPYIEDITCSLRQIHNKNQINLIVGDYRTKDNMGSIPLEETLDIIKQNSSYPIYTKTQPYVNAGAIGGVVDWSEKNGEVLGDMIIKLYNGEKIANIKPLYGSYEQNVFNYKAMCENNINPLLLPSDSLFINKDFFDFLLPKHIKIIIIIIIIIIILLLTLFSYRCFFNKKQALISEILLKQANESERLKTEFISTVSHELRTPLNIILNTCKLLNYKINQSSINKEYLKDKLYYIDKNSHRLLRLVNNIIDITKIESGYVKPYFKIHNIVEVIEETVLSIVDLAKEHSIDIIFDTEHEEILTAIDKSSTERIILNLLSNSIKFTPPQGVITVVMKKEAAEVIVEIKDTGIGIPNSQLPNIFNRFYQVDSSFTRSNEGSGLGLFIVKSLIEVQKGTISINSKEGLGTTCIISFPISLEEDTCVNYNLGSKELEQLVKLEMADINLQND